MRQATTFSQEWHDEATEQQLKHKCLFYSEEVSFQLKANRKNARGSALAHSPTPNVYMERDVIVLLTSPLVAELMKKFGWTDL